MPLRWPLGWRPGIAVSLQDGPTGHRRESEGEGEGEGRPLPR